MGILLGFALFGLAVFLFCILPIVLGVMALQQIDRSGGVQRGRGLALLAIALGALGLLSVPVVVILGTFTVRSASASTLSARVSASSAMPMAPSGAGAGGAGGPAGWGGSPRGAGGNGSVIAVPPPVLPRAPAAAPSHTSVGEQNVEDDSAPATPAAPAPAPSPKREPNANSKGGSVGEQKVDF